MSNFNEFTHLYQLSKTLRFELKPIGETLKHFNESGILDQDEHRAESYKKVKKLIDRYHKEFMEEALRDFVFQMDNEERITLLVNTFSCIPSAKEPKLKTMTSRKLRRTCGNRLQSISKLHPSTRICLSKS